jgi:drug/metabolite transporter (DMT)-like permease
MARSGLDHGLSALALAAWRLTLAGAVVLIILAVRSVRTRPAPVAVRDRGILVLAGLCLSVHFAAWFASLQYLSVARSTLLVTTAPAWAGLGGILLGQRLSARFWAGLGVAAIGAWLVTGHDSNSLARGVAGETVLGDGLAVLGAVAVAAYLMLTQRLQTSVGTATVVAWTYPSAAAWTWAWIAIHSTGSAWPARQAWASVVGMALIPQLIGHTAMNWSLRYFAAGVVSAATLLEPVFAGALAWLLLKEPLTTVQIIGAVALLLGVGLTLRSDEGTTIADCKMQNAN